MWRCAPCGGTVDSRDVESESAAVEARGLRRVVFGVCCCWWVKATRRMSRKLAELWVHDVRVCAARRPITSPVRSNDSCSTATSETFTARDNRQSIRGSSTANVGGVGSSEFLYRWQARRNAFWCALRRCIPRASETLVCSCGVDVSMRKRYQRRKEYPTLPENTENAIQIPHT